MATSVGTAYIDTRLDTRSLNKQLDKASGSMLGKFKKIGLAVGAAVGGALVVGQIKKSIDAASDLNETLSKTQQVFGIAAQNMVRWSEQTAKSMGISQRAALDGATTFALFGQMAGKTEEETAKFSQQLVGLSADLASFYNTSPEDAMRAIGSTLRGETEAIRRYNVLINQTTLSQAALRLGLIKTEKDALTPQQKVLAANAVIWEQTKKAQGDFTRTSGGVANQTRIINALFEEMYAKIGQGLLPVLEKLLPYFNAALEEIGPALGEVTKKVGDMLMAWTDSGAFTALYEGIKNGLRTIWDLLTTIGSIVGPFIAAALAGFTSLSAILSTVAGNAIAVKVAVIALVTAMAGAKVKNFVDSLSGASQALQGFVMGGRGATAVSMGLAPGLTMAQAGMTRMATATNIAKSAFSAMGGGVGVAVAAVTTLAVVIGGDLVSSFGKSKSAAADVALANKNVADSVRAIQDAINTYIGGILGYETALQNQKRSVREVTQAQKDLAAARATGNQAAIVAAEDRLVEARLNQRRAILDVKSAEASANTERQQVAQRIRESTNAVSAQVNAWKLSNGMNALSVIQMSKTAAGQAELRKKTAELNAAIGKTEGYREQRKAARDMLEQYKLVGNASPRLVKALEAASTAKTPDQFIKRWGEVEKVLRDTGNKAAPAAKKTGDAARKAVDGAAEAVTPKITEWQSIIQTTTGNTSIRVGEDVRTLNEWLRKAGDRSSPVVAAVVAKNISNVASIITNGTGNMVTMTEANVKNINNRLRGIGQAITSKNVTGLLQDLRTTIINATGSQTVAISQMLTGVGKGKTKAVSLITEMLSDINRLSGKALARGISAAEGLLAAMKAKVVRIQEAAVAAKDKFATSIDTFVSRALAAYDRLGEKADAAYNKMMDAPTVEETAYKTAFDAEQAARDERRMTELRNSSAAAYRAWQDSLAADSGAWLEDQQRLEQEYNQANQALLDAQKDNELTSLRETAEASRVLKEQSRQEELARRAQEREDAKAHFEQVLAEQQAALLRGEINAAQFSTGVTNALNAIGVNAGTVATVMGNTMTGMFSDSLSDMLESSKGVIEAMAALRAIDEKGGLRDAIAKLTKAINGIKKKKKVPSLASGGVVSRPTLALVGDASTPEIVTPEKLMRQIVREEGVTGGGNTEVRVFIGDKELRNIVRAEVLTADNDVTRRVYAGVR